jgi:hypothetical protein
MPAVQNLTSMQQPNVLDEGTDGGPPFLDLDGTLEDFTFGSAVDDSATEGLSL